MNTVLQTVQEPIAGSFPCSTRESRSPTPPTSVHKLRPGDIDVVGAMGDSLTASFGNMATNVLQVYVENRGMSWSGGMCSTAESLASIVTKTLGK